MANGHVEFWMCMVNGQFKTTQERLPKYKYYNKAQAEAEAERLAKLTGEDVFLLHACKFIRVLKPTPPTEWVKMYPEGTYNK